MSSQARHERIATMKEEATCLHLRHVYDAIARRKVDIERCPGFKDTPRHVVRDHGLALAPQDAGWRESGAIAGGKAKLKGEVADGNDFSFFSEN